MLIFKAPNTEPKNAVTAPNKIAIIKLPVNAKIKIEIAHPYAAPNRSLPFHETSPSFARSSDPIRAPTPIPAVSIPSSSGPPPITSWLKAGKRKLDAFPKAGGISPTSIKPKTTFSFQTNPNPSFKSSIDEVFDLFLGLQ